MESDKKNVTQLALDLSLTPKNLYFLVLYNTHFKILNMNNIGSFEANLTHLDLDISLIHKMPIKIK